MSVKAPFESPGTLAEMQKISVFPLFSYSVKLSKF